MLEKKKKFKGIRGIAGGSIFYNFGGKEYELKNGITEIYDYIAFNKEGAWFPKDHWELTPIINFGSMQSGKSKYNQAICQLGDDVFADTDAGFQCYLTNDLEFTLNYLNREENIENRKKVIFLVFDDAMGDKAVGMNSLRTFDSKNKSFEEIMSMVRHKLANEDDNGNPDPRVKNGFCVLIFSIQSLKRLSTFVRDNSALRIYKTAYDQLEKEFSIEDWDFLRGITNDSDKHIYASRGYALGKSKTDTMKFYFPLSNYKIPVLLNDYKEEKEKYKKLMAELNEFYNPDIQSKEIQAFIFMWGKHNHINFSAGEMREIELELIYNTLMYGTPKNENENKLSLEAIAKLRERGISPNILAEFYEKSQAQLYRDLDSYEKRKDLQISQEE